MFEELAQQHTNMWYDEVKDYDFNNPGFSSSTGHFTQLVWVNSKRAGFGIGVDSSGSSFVGVGNYGTVQSLSFI